MRHDFYCFQSLENIEEMRGGFAPPPFQLSGQMLHTFRMWVVSLHVLSPSPSPSLSTSKFIIVPMATDRLTDRLGSEPILSVGVNLTGTKCVNGPLPLSPTYTGCEEDLLPPANEVAVWYSFHTRVSSRGWGYLVTCPLGEGVGGYVCNNT